MEGPSSLNDHLLLLQVIFSACELGVFDLLLGAPGPLSARHVAHELRTSVDGMERLLDALVGMEVLEVEPAEGTGEGEEPAEGTGEGEEPAEGTGEEEEPAEGTGDDTYIYNNHHVSFCREGRNQNEKTFGLQPEDPFQAVYRSEEEMLKFMGLMDSSWILDGHDIATAFDLSCFQKIVDLGGCTGALAREMAKAYPSSSVSVLDLPTVVDAAKKYFSRENDDVVFHSGDFFLGDVPPADLYVLARIVHDWPEEKCLSLLRKLHDTCRPGGGVLLVEAMLLETRRGPLMAQIFSLNMLVQMEGRERPPSGYTRLLNDAGFHDVQVCRTGKSYDAILAVR
uniref:Acetylserotonin O-methyltransferase n=1 Tax=Cyclopterus lumpus TaxID=8103 RepID=A0A8C2XJI8_CYCLU